MSEIRQIRSETDILSVLNSDITNKEESMQYWIGRLASSRGDYLRNNTKEQWDSIINRTTSHLKLGHIIAENWQEASKLPIPSRQTHALEALYHKASLTAQVATVDSKFEPQWEHLIPSKENFYRLAIFGEQFMGAINQLEFRGNLNLQSMHEGVLYGVQYLFSNYPPYVDMYDTLRNAMDDILHQQVFLYGRFR